MLLDKITDLTFYIFIIKKLRIPFNIIDCYFAIKFFFDIGGMVRLAFTMMLA